MGAAKLVASAKYFHPDIPMFVLGSEEMEGFNIKAVESLHPFVINKFIDEYEKVVYLDADSMIVGKLDELLAAIDAYDVIGVRNNNDYDLAGIGNPITQDGLSVQEYLNAGLVATRNKLFVEEWMKDYKTYGRLLPFGAQSVLNNIYKNYNHFILDAKESNVFYGISALAGTETHWDSWKQISIVNGELILLDKKVKVLHHAGGFKTDKLGFYMFNKETRERLIEITS